MICNICLIEKDTNCFRKRLKYCIDCENKKKREKYKENRESEIERVKIYQKTSEKRKEWLSNNKEVINERNRIYKKKRRKTDPLYRIKNNIKNIKNKKSPQ